MKKAITYLTIGCALLIQTILLAASSDSLQWYTNYEQALDAAKESNMPIFLLFEGSDWCGWCKKLDKEVLNTTTFADLMGDKLVFVKIDFPMTNRLTPDQESYNERLRDSFKVDGFPTVLILDANGNRLASMSYIPGGPKNFAEHVDAIINNH